MEVTNAQVTGARNGRIKGEKEKEEGNEKKRRKKRKRGKMRKEG